MTARENILYRLCLQHIAEKRPYTVHTKLLCVEFTFLNGFFDRFLNQLSIPVIVERLFGPDNGLNLNFKLIMARLTNVPVGHMEVIAFRKRGFDGIAANITG